MSETTIQIVITAFIASVPPTILAIATLITSRAAARSAKKAANVAVVTAGVASSKADQLAEKADRLAEKTELVHTLVNSGYGALLKDKAEALRRVAQLSQNPQDAIAAEFAEKALEEHMAKRRAAELKEEIPS